MSTLQETTETVRAAKTRLSAWLLSLPDDLIYLGPALGAGTILYAVYLLTHTYPAFGAGLYLVMAEQIQLAGWGLPTRIPSYTPSGVPFAYPPLGHYVVAAIETLTGIAPERLSRILPGLYTIAYLIPAYALGHGLLESKRQAGVAALLVAVSPPVIQWHLSAGGVVRALAFCFLLTGLYMGVELFKYGNRRWRGPAIVCFGLTVLTHPTYTAVFALSYLWFYTAFDRTRTGLQDGAVVALGGVTLAIPWLGQVVANHGVGVFTHAAGTHGGVGKQLPLALEVLSTHPTVKLASVLQRAGPGTGGGPGISPGMVVLSGWAALIILGALVLAWRRAWVLPVWFLLVGVMVPKERFAFLVGAFILTAVAFRELEVLRTSLTERLEWPQWSRAVLFGILCCSAVTFGGLYAGGSLDTHAGTASLPPFMDSESEAAMSWAASETPDDATFVVLGDAAEWFPYYAERTLGVGPWGVEWEGQSAYQQQLSSFRQLSTCESEACLHTELEESGSSPAYLYVPTQPYTVRGTAHQPSTQLHAELRASPRYRVVFENSGVAVFELTDAPRETADSAAAPDTVAAP